MKKINPILLILVFLVAMKFAVAEQGCYIFKESNHYCSDLEESLASADCSNYGNCNLNEVFLAGNSCNDPQIFPECEKILCKNTCNYEVLGKCISGELMPGEEAVWCKPGCCQFNYGETRFCDFKENQGSCKTEADNHQTNTFDFKLNSKQECLKICSGLKPVEEKQAEPPKAENVKTNLTWDWLWFVLILSGLVLFFYLFYLENKLRNTGFEKDPGEVHFFRRNPQKEEQRKKEAKEREKRITRLIDERERKTKEKEREELFGLFGVGEANNKKVSHIARLRKIANFYGAKKFRKKEKEVFKDVDALIEDFKNPKKIEKLTEDEAKEIFNKLKNLVKKQK